MKMPPLDRDSVHGFTLTEIAIVLGLIGTILGAIWSAASHVSATQKITKASTQFLQIVSSVRSIYSTRSSFSGGETDITPSLISNGSVFDADMMQAGHAFPITPFGGDAHVYTAAFSNTTFRVSYYTVTLAQCVQLATVIGGQASSYGPVNLVVACNGNDLTSLGGVPLTDAAITAACNLNVGAGCSSVEFDFGL